MECVSAISVTITEYMAECLITSTVNIAKRKSVDKLQGNEREDFINKNGVGKINDNGILRVNSLSENEEGMKKEFTDSKGTSPYE